MANRHNFARVFGVDLVPANPLLVEEAARFAEAQRAAAEQQRLMREQYAARLAEQKKLAAEPPWMEEYDEVTNG